MNATLHIAWNICAVAGAVWLALGIAFGIAAAFVDPNGGP